MKKGPTNVIDFKTRKSLLPFQVRAILMAQFSESKESDHGTEMFVQKLEQRLVSAGAATIVNFVQDGVTSFLERKK